MDKQRIRTFLIGGAAGVIAGILLAPRSGRELRGSISNRTGEARERGRERYFDVGERMRERISRARDNDFRRAPANDVDPEDTASAAVERPVFHEAWPPLRDVSRDVPAEPEAEPAPELIVDAAEEDSILEDKPVFDETSLSRSEELRRKVRETRARLDERRGKPSGGEDETL